MKNLAVILLFAVFSASTVGSASSLPPKAVATLDAGLQAALQVASPDTIFDVLIASSDSWTSLESVDKAAVRETDMAARHRAVEMQLRAHLANSKSNLVSALSAASARLRIVDRFWIANLVHIQTDRAGLLSLASSAAVTRILVNAHVELIEPLAIAAADAVATGAQVNLDAVGARSLWALGLTGRGRLVASIDTGVEGSHPALKNNWRGLQGDTSASWFDPMQAPSPMDNNGHGTHVMGTMVGHDGADTIGLAPDAQWITAAVIDRGASLGATIADILRALQWIADPDGNPATSDDVPDVVCNSWGISQQIISPCDSIFFQAISNVEAMGIVCVFAAGNEGPNSMTIRNPADHAASPTTTFSVGAADGTLPGFPIPSFSSRGPSACDGLTIKPEIVAPGVAIRSSYKGQTYRVMNGTSMAAPHVAAAVALLRQYNPNLTPDQIKLALLSTATDIADPGEDNESGRGLLNLPAALAALAPVSRPSVSVAATRVDTFGDGVLAPGETVPFSVTLAGQTSDARHLVARLWPLTTGVTVPLDTAYFDLVPAGMTVDNAGSPFTVSVLPSVPVGDSLRLELSLSGDPNLGMWKDTLSLICGLPDRGMVRTIGGGRMALSVSNFGQLGLGPGSQLNAGGVGWRDSVTGNNALFEASLLVAASAGRLSDASRRPSGVATFDFSPLDSLTVTTQPDGALSGTAVFDDQRAVSPAGVQVSQTVTSYPGPNGSAYAIVEWRIRNRTTMTIDSLRCGLLLDIDLPASSSTLEHVQADLGSGGFYHLADGGVPITGVIPLNAPFGVCRYFQNPAGIKRSFTPEEKLAALQPGMNSPQIGAGDGMEILAALPADLPPAGEVQFVMALIMADSPDLFSLAADDAQRRWLGVTDVKDGGDGNALVPSVLLNQNFPNPFNPSTAISFSLAHDGYVRLAIFNLLGQTVRTLADGWNNAGTMTVLWDGADANGHTVASGVYFYRIETARASNTKKMVLLR